MSVPDKVCFESFLKRTSAVLISHSPSLAVRVTQAWRCVLWE